MSLVFLAITILTYGFSHWWAKCNRPHKPDEHSAEFLFYGKQQELNSRLQNALNNNSFLKLLLWKKEEWIINENSGFLHYGTYYHIQIVPEKNHLKILVFVQPKLIGSKDYLSPSLIELFKEIELSDVG